MGFLTLLYFLCHFQLQQIVISNFFMFEENRTKSLPTNLIFHIIHVHAKVFLTTVKILLPTKSEINT